MIHHDEHDKDHADDQVGRCYSQSPAKWEQDAAEQHRQVEKAQCSHEIHRVSLEQQHSRRCRKTQDYQCPGAEVKMPAPVQPVQAQQEASGKQPDKNFDNVGGRIQQNVQRNGHCQGSSQPNQQPGQHPAFAPESIYRFWGCRASGSFRSRWSGMMVHEQLSSKLSYTFGC